MAATNPTVTATEITTNESFTASLDTAPERAGTYYIYAPPGQYRVTASMPGYQAQTRDVTIVSGDDPPDRSGLHAPARLAAWGDCERSTIMV